MQPSISPLQRSPDCSLKLCGKSGWGGLEDVLGLCLGGDPETEQHMQTKVAENEQTADIWCAEMIITPIAAESHSPHSL